jgi:hypothetical protein
LLVLALISPACAELEVFTQGTGGGAGSPPSGSLSVSSMEFTPAPST